MMRTTVTLDPDTEHLLRIEVQRSGRSFKEVLNEAIRRSFAGDSQESVQVRPLFKKPFPKEWEGSSMNRLADALDDEETIRELAR